MNWIRCFIFISLPTLAADKQQIHHAFLQLLAEQISAILRSEAEDIPVFSIDQLPTVQARIADLYPELVVSQDPITDIFSLISKWHRQIFSNHVSRFDNSKAKFSSSFICLLLVLLDRSNVALQRLDFQAVEIANQKEIELRKKWMKQKEESWTYVRTLESKRLIRISESEFRFALLKEVHFAELLKINIRKVGTEFRWSIETFQSPTEASNDLEGLLRQSIGREIRPYRDLSLTCRRWFDIIWPL